MSQWMAILQKQLHDICNCFETDLVHVHIVTKGSAEYGERFYSCINIFMSRHDLLLFNCTVRVAFRSYEVCIIAIPLVGDCELADLNGPRVANPGKF